MQATIKNGHILPYEDRSADLMAASFHMRTDLQIFLTLSLFQYLGAYGLVVLYRTPWFTGQDSMVYWTGLHGFDNGFDGASGLVVPTLSRRKLSRVQTLLKSRERS